MDVEAGQNWTRVMKKLVNQKNLVDPIQNLWSQMLINRKFLMKQTYKVLIDDSSRVQWNSLMLHNMARPKAKITLWLLCHGNILRKDLKGLE